MEEAVKIFVIANSFGLDSTAHLWNVLKDSGIQEVTIAVAYIGGCTLDQHWSNIQDASRAYEYHKNTDGVFRVTTDAALLDMLQDERWDIITVQQAGNGQYSTSAFAHLDDILDWICRNKTNSEAKIYYNMVWPYSSRCTDLIFVDSFHGNCDEMYDMIEYCTRNVVVPNQAFAGIIPGGAAIRYLRDSRLTEDDIYRDELHLSHFYGRYTIALLWYAYLFNGDITKIRWHPGDHGDAEKELPLIHEAVEHALKTVYSF